MNYHMIAFFLGFLLDLLFGDPHEFPHPVRLMGRFILFLERRLLQAEPGRQESSESQESSARNPQQEFQRGVCMVAAVLMATWLTAAALLLAAYCLHPLLGIVAETLMTYQILAVKCLKDESKKVFQCLESGNLPKARAALSMIVGRDTERLDAEGIAKAAIETVAENTSDGVIAPMLYTAAGGPALGFLYKAVNTMDSMVGYKNDRYLYFGRAAAKLDDWANYIPARISACLMIAAAFLLGKPFSAKDAWRIYRRDGRKHASPNAAQTEAVCAGALGIQLAGDASYFGKIVKKPYIGEEKRRTEKEDILRVNRLMYQTAAIGEILCLLTMAAVWKSL